MPWPAAGPASWLPARPSPRRRFGTTAPPGASCGGVSSVFALPSWQAGLRATQASGAAALTHRGVPDVSGDADPETGYAVRIDGTDTTIGGTSAVAPLWAGLLARINAINGAPVGFVNAQLYARSAALNDVTAGSNGDFIAAVGWDACTGLGSPDGRRLLRLYRRQRAADAGRLAPNRDNVVARQAWMPARPDRLSPARRLNWPLDQQSGAP